jgi:hypothetical protein
MRNPQARGHAKRHARGQGSGIRQADATDLSTWHESTWQANGQDIAVPAMAKRIKKAVMEKSLR